jgi:hypothetical protein
MYHDLNRSRRWYDVIPVPKTLIVLRWWFHLSRNGARGRYFVDVAAFLLCSQPLEIIQCKVDAESRSGNSNPRKHMETKAYYRLGRK